MPVPLGYPYWVRSTGAAHPVCLLSVWPKRALHRHCLSPAPGGIRRSAACQCYLGAAGAASADLATGTAPKSTSNEHLSRVFSRTAVEAPSRRLHLGDTALGLLAFPLDTRGKVFVRGSPGRSARSQLHGRKPQPPCIMSA